MLRLLDPLLLALSRLLVARGVLFPDLIERLKRHYIEAAKASTSGKITDSRLSVLTGLQRRDIVRLREEEPKAERSNHLARLIALWQTDPVYAVFGTAKALAKNGPAPSFEELARIVRKDVHPRTMLDTLVATGTIEVCDDGHAVRLVKTSYQPLAGSEDQLSYLSRNLADHLNAATENVLGQAPPHFERAVHYTHLTAAQVDELQAEFNAAQMDIFERLSDRAAAMKRENPKTAQGRFRAGGYFYKKTEDDK